MPSLKSPRKGSLQFWPRKRVSKFLPSVNWNAINSGKNIKGFICYKVGMTSAIAKDQTPNSMTLGKRVAIPVTILECPPIKIFSVRFYRNNIVAKEIINENVDKELGRKVKLPKIKHKLEDIKHNEYEDVRIIVYSEVKKTGIKKTPDLVEVGLNGSFEEKIKFIKEHMNKDLYVENFFSSGQLVDLRGLTKGKGLQGPVKRFGIQLKNHKSEKGRRRPGSLGPWHPARVTFRVPMAGQIGLFNRVVYNNHILKIGKAEDKLANIKNYGDVKTDYLLVYGSVQGPAKRQLLITAPLRETKKQKKKKYEFLELK
mgnify:CR=1 FL=1